MAEPRQVLIINLHAAENAGDAALLEMAIRTVRTAFPEAGLTLAMNVPAADFESSGRVIASITAACRRTTPSGRSTWRPATPWLLLTGLLAALLYRWLGRYPPALLARDLRPIVRAYADADLVIGCPGNILSTSGRFGLPFLIAAYTIAYALLMRKPLYVLPQSIGPFRHRWERGIARRLYASARLLFLREPYSYRVAQSIGLPQDRIHVVPDLAFDFPAARAEEAHALLAGLGIGRDRPLLGVTVLNRLLPYVPESVWERYERATANVLARFMREHGAGVVFFPQVTGPMPREDDRLGAHRVLDLMGHPVGAVVVDRPVRPGELKALYGLTDVYIGTRMHSVIFAVSQGVPTLSIEYQTKSRGLAEMLGTERWTIMLNEVTEEKLCEMLDDLWQQRVSVRAMLVSRVSDLVRETREVGHLMARDYHDR